MVDDVSNAGSGLNAHTPAAAAAAAAAAATAATAARTVHHRVCSPHHFTPHFLIQWPLQLPFPSIPIHLLSSFLGPLCTVVRYGTVSAYLSLWHEWADAIGQYKVAISTEQVGVCAQGTIQNVQKLTITRVGFQAQLVLTNNGVAPLTALQVVLVVRPSSTNELATSLFSIGQPTVISGFVQDPNTPLVPSFSLPANTVGTLTWCIIPLRRSPQCCVALARR
jgi:hypothetical protein